MEAAMPSTVINGFEYDARTERLVVTFVTGRIYEYSNVPVETYRAFRSAFSKGKFFNEQIRDRYDCRELTRTAG
jgi:hypothetical protein